MKAESHSHRGEPDSRPEAMWDSNRTRDRTWFSVISRDIRARCSWRDRFGGYGGSIVVDVGSSGGGGIAEDGFGEVRAYTRAAAEASANTLNSATGETFPTASTAPPMVTICLTLRNASGSSAAARAQFVSGPMAMMVIVSASFSRKILKISLYAG